MNLRQMEYAVLLSQAGSFSQLAQQLKISQPALSKQILNLENELGVCLFDRNHSPITPTAAGVHFVQQAKALLYQEQQLVRTMEQFRQGQRGQLVIGTTPFRSSYLLPEVVRRVRQNFPGVRVRLVEKGSDALRKDAADGKFDFSVINLPVDDPTLEATLLEPDQLVLVVPDALIPQAELPQADRIDFSQCSQLPFAVASPGQEMRILFDKLCVEAEFSPHIAAEVVGLTTAWEMVCSGFAATLLPLQFVRRFQAHHSIHIFWLNNRTSLRQPAVITKRGQYLSPYAQYAISLLTGKNNNTP